MFRGNHLGWACVVLGLPFLILGVYSYSFERRRWSNATAGSAGKPWTPLTLIVGGVALILGGIVAILKALAESSGDDD